MGKYRKKQMFFLRKQSKNSVKWLYDHLTEGGLFSDLLLFFRITGRNQNEKSCFCILFSENPQLFWKISVSAAGAASMPAKY